MFCQRMMKMNSLIIEVLSPLYRRHYSDGMYLISKCDVLLILKLLDLYDHSTWVTRWWRESFHLFILAILSVSSTLHSTTTHSHIDWPLSSSRVELHDGLWQKRREEELCRCVRWRQSQRTTVSGPRRYYILSSMLWRAERYYSQLVMRKPYHFVDPL